MRASHFLEKENKLKGKISHLKISNSVHILKLFLLQMFKPDKITTFHEQISIFQCNQKFEMSIRDIPAISRRT